MLRRLIDGLGLAVLAWLVIARLEAGEVALGLALGVVIAFTGWRIYRLWQRYRQLLADLAAARASQQSDDAADRQRAERLLCSQRLIRAADMGLWSGFVMGAAATDYGPIAAAGGDVGSGYDAFGGDDGGGVIGGDFGGGGFDGGM